MGYGLTQPPPTLARRSSQLAAAASALSTTEKYVTLSRGCAKKTRSKPQPACTVGFVKAIFWGHPLLCKSFNPKGLRRGEDGPQVLSPAAQPSYR